ncbi:polysaccharide chain length modulation protein, partial [Acinetobacter baumannii]|nr:polysaccharide chain length modulation protein [Acinetobacter baumannii]
MTQPLPGAQAVNVENELDIRGLFRALWAGKGWIVGGAALFAAIVLVYT